MADILLEADSHTDPNFVHIASVRHNCVGAGDCAVRIFDVNTGKLMV